MIAVATFAVLVVPAASLAATFRVTSTADRPDTLPGDGRCLTTGSGCTLRAAIQEAEARPGEAHTIVLFAGVFALNAQLGAFEDFSVTGDLDVRGDITVTGAGALVPRRQLPRRHW